MSAPLLCRALVLTASALLFSCNDGGGPNGTDPPEVALTIPTAFVVGDHITVLVTTQGCKSVSKAVILNTSLSGQQTLKTFTYSATPTSVDIGTADVPFHTTGIQANLSLSAQVTCDDARTNTSEQRGATLFPVEQAYTLANDEQVVPDEFFVEGSGSTATFVGCVGSSNGTNGLARVDINGAVLAQNFNLSIPCDHTTYYSDTTVDGTRWMLTPNVGAQAFDAQTLALTSVAKWNDTAGSGTIEALPAQYMAVGPDGDAVLWQPGAASTGGEGGEDLFRVKHRGGCPSTNDCDTTLWGKTLPGAQSNPVVLSDSSAVSQIVRDEGTVAGGGSATIEVCSYPYVDPSASAGFCYKLFDIPRATLDAFPVFFGTLTANDAVAYVPYNLDTSTTTTPLFSMRAAVAQGTHQSYWSSDPVLQGTAFVALPFDNDSVVGAVGTNTVYFLRASDGAILNKGSTPLAPAGGLTVNYVASSGTGSEFYVLSGTSGQPLPTELVAVDSPQAGELFRLRVGDASSVFLGIDSDSQPWIRVAAVLAKPYTLAKYRQLLSQ